MFIRPANVEDIQEIVAIHVQAWKESYQGMIDQSYLDSLQFSIERMSRRENFFNENPLRQGFVAVQGHKIFGFVDAGPSREPDGAIGEIYAIYLLQEYQSQGIGRLLWEAAVQHLSTNQLIPFIVWGLSQNLKARGFYEKQGGKLLTTKDADIGGKMYSEVCYVFG